MGQANKQVTVTSGFGFGNIIAVILSWQLHHSVMWAFIHGFFGWFYLLYLCLGGDLP